MKRHILLPLMLTAMVLYGCSSGRYTPSADTVRSAQVIWAGADSINLYNGYILYRNKCGGCHYLYRPDSYTIAEWELLLPPMREEAKMTDEEYRNLRVYLLSMSRSDTTGSVLPLPRAGIP